MADENEQGGGSGGGNGQAVIVVKKKNRGGGHPHHGGAWKVAYADFVTAMMAFFLLLWLLSSTTEEQKSGIAHYFNPPNNAIEYGGGDGIMGGASAVETAQQAPKDAPVLPPQQQENQDLSVQASEDSLFRQVAEEIKNTVMSIPQLQMLMQNMLIDVTAEGLRIQITDSAERPLFANGSADMMPYTKQMLTIMADVLARLPNQLAIGGHTDVVPYRGALPQYSNWELSTDRAQAARRVLEFEGIPDARMSRVAGYAAQDLLLKDEPQHPKNRRISVIVLRAKKGPVAAFTEQGLALPVVTGPRVP